MATNKTIQPTNVTVQIPAMSDQPNMSVPANAIDKSIDAINKIAIATNVATSDTLANVQAALVTLAGTIADGVEIPIKFGISTAVDVFSITTYIGTLMRISNQRYCVNLRNSLYANVEIIGNYKDGAWAWAQIATRSSTRCKTKTFTMDCNSAAMGGVGYCGEAQLSSSDIENATVVVPQFARKSGYNYPILATYEGGSLRLYSPTSLESVSVGVVLFYF